MRSVSDTWSIFEISRRYNNLFDTSDSGQREILNLFGIKLILSLRVGKSVDEISSNVYVYDNILFLIRIQSTLGALLQTKCRNIYLALAVFVCIALSCFQGTL